MKPTELLEILRVAEQLKCRTRHCDTTSGRRESVAEHSWRLCLMALLLRDEFPEADMDRVLQMCVIHDLGEAFTGDIPTFLKTGQDEDEEEGVLENWFQSFPSPAKEEMLSLLLEMEEMKTREAKIYTAMDKLEALIQHNESDIATWLPLEYDLQKKYAWETVEFSAYLKALRQQVYEDTLEKIREAEA